MRGVKELLFRRLGRLEQLRPLARVLWRNAAPEMRRPPREEAKVFVSHAFPHVDLHPTVLAEVLAAQTSALRGHDASRPADVSSKVLKS